MSTKPTAHSLPHNAVIAHTLKTRRLVTRLSKSSLITLALRWLDQKLCRDFAPDWTDPDDDEYDEDGTVEHSLDEILALYEELGSVARFRAKDVSERMFAWEWRNGFTLLGIAELEWQYLLDNPTSSKWRAFLLSPINPQRSIRKTEPLRPRFYTPLFVSTLHTTLKPQRSAHIFATTHPTLPLTMIRVSLHETHTALSFPARNHIFWLAFPAGSDHIFTTLSAPARLADTVKSAIADAISRTGSRWELKPGRMITKTLESMCTLRGAEGGATGGLIGGWSVYADKNGLENNPLEPPREVGLSKLRDEENDDGRMKRRKLVQGRFGNTSRDDGAAIEDVFFEIREKYIDDGGGDAQTGGDGDDDSDSGDEEDDSDSEDGGQGEEFVPTIGIRFQGEHVFAGIKELAEARKDIIGLGKLPGWMTGEEGVSSGIVKNGRVTRGKKRGAGNFSASTV